MGILWRFLVLSLGGWFLAGFIFAHRLPNPLPAEWVSASIATCLALAWLWQYWSKSRKNGLQP
jgi:hypothetical protein